jgi:hypothetical protein
MPKISHCVSGPQKGRGKIRVFGRKGNALVDPLPLSDLRPAGTDDVVSIVTLDDVIPAVTSRRVVLTVHVGGDEAKVLKGARK